LVSPSTTTSMPISHPWVTPGADRSPTFQPVTSRSGSGITGSLLPAASTAAGAAVRAAALGAHRVVLQGHLMRG